METGPTSADYAYGNAQDALSRTSQLLSRANKLEKRIDELENVVVQILQILEDNGVTVNITT